MTAVLATYYLPRRRLSGELRGPSHGLALSGGHRLVGTALRAGAAASEAARRSTDGHRVHADHNRHRFGYLPATACFFTDGVLRPHRPTTRRLTSPDRDQRQRKPAAARTWRAASWRPSTDMRRPTTWAHDDA